MPFLQMDRMVEALIIHSFENKCSKDCLKEVAQSARLTLNEVKVTNLNFLPPLVRTCKKKKCLKDWKQKLTGFANLSRWWVGIVEVTDLSLVVVVFQWVLRERERGAWWKEASNGGHQYYWWSS